MLQANYQPSSYRYEASVRSRVSTWLLTLAATALIILMLIKLGAVPAIVREAQPVTIQLLPEQHISPEPSHTATKTKHASGGATARTLEHPVRPTPTPTSQTPSPTPPVPWNVIPLTQAEFAASDVTKLPSHRDDANAGGAGTQAAGNGNDTGSDEGVGEGPGGERLYNAEWYVKPTHAELATYLPQTNQPGWGMIACRTIANFHVDDCRELDESPGSGLARALRQAAWQFRVRPPRIGGKPMIGAWVRIRFDFNQANPD